LTPGKKIPEETPSTHQKNKGKKRKNKVSSESRLPDIWDEMVANFPAVVGVAGEVGDEEVFFVEEAGGECGKKERHEEKGPVRAKGQRGSEEKDERAEVHGVAHESVQASGDDLLALFNPDGRCGVSVGAKNKEGDGHACDDAEFAKKYEGNRDIGPTETIVEAWQDDHRQRETHGERQDQLLRGARLGTRAGFETVFNEMRIGAKEIESDGELGSGKDDPKEPGLPEIDRPSRQEKQSRNERLKKRQSGESVSRECIHGARRAQTIRPTRIDANTRPADLSAPGNWPKVRRRVGVINPFVTNGTDVARDTATATQLDRALILHFQFLKRTAFR